MLLLQLIFINSAFFSFNFFSSFFPLYFSLFFFLLQFLSFGQVMDVSVIKFWNEFAFFQRSSKNVQFWVDCFIYIYNAYSFMFDIKGGRPHQRWSRQLSVLEAQFLLAWKRNTYFHIIIACIICDCFSVWSPVGRAYVQWNIWWLPTPPDSYSYCKSNVWNLPTYSKKLLLNCNYIKSHKHLFTSPSTSLWC